MSILLNGAVDAGTGTFKVDGDALAVTSRPFMAQIESEQIQVIAAGTDAWLVRRGQNGTFPVAHADDVAIVPLYGTEQSSAPGASPIVLGAPVAQAQAQSTTVEAAFVEAGAHTYTATIPIPAGATVLDVIFRNTVVWAAATSASMTCGDTATATGYFTATNVKTTPAADTNGGGAGLSSRLSLGASAGAYKGGGGVFYPTADNIVCTIVSVGAGTAGRSRLLVEYALPVAQAVVVV